jgi:hypothetical protein
MMRLRRASVIAVLSLLISAATAYAEEAWESEPATICWQNAWTFTVLGAIGLVVILALRGATTTNCITVTLGGAYLGGRPVSACWPTSFSSRSTAAHRFNYRYLVFN